MTEETAKELTPTTVSELAKVVVSAKHEIRKALAEMEGLVPSPIDKSRLYVLADDLITAGRNIMAVGRQLADSIIEDDTKSLVQMD